MDKWTSRRRSLRPRNRLPTHQPDRPTPRQCSGCGVYVGNRPTQPKTAVYYPHDYPQKCVAVGGQRWTRRAVYGRPKPAHLRIRAHDARRWRSSVDAGGRGRKAFVRYPSTPGIHYTINSYAGQIATYGQITHTVTHKCWWLRKQASGGPFWGFWRLRRAGIRSLEGVGSAASSTLTRGFARAVGPAR